MSLFRSQLRLVRTVELVASVTPAVTLAAAASGSGCWLCSSLLLGSSVIFSSHKIHDIEIFSHVSGGVVVGAVIQKNGVLHEMGIVLPQQPGYYGQYGPGEHSGPQFEEVER